MLLIGAPKFLAGPNLTTALWLGGWLRDVDQCVARIEGVLIERDKLVEPAAGN